MIVYGSTLSPFVRKVAAVLAEKGLDYELKRIPLGSADPDFLEASPFGKMPAFRDGAFAISDSTAICAYVEKKHPTPSLMPDDPVDHARTIWFEEFGDTIVGKAGGAMFFNRVVSPRFLQRAGDDAVADAAERDDLPRILDYLERTVPESGYLVADRFTLADIAVACPFANIDYCGVAIDGTRWPRTAAYLDGILARPSLARLLAADKAFLARAA